MSSKKNMDDARKFLWEDDETGSTTAASRNSGASQARGFSTREFAVDQSVNLMDMVGGAGGASSAAGGGRQSSGSSTRLSGAIAGLFRGSSPGTTSLSGGSGKAPRFDEYGDAAPSADADEYISDKRRRLNPVWAAIVNTADSTKMVLGRFGLHGSKLVMCLLVGFGLVGGGLYLALSSSDGSDRSSSAAAAGGDVINTDGLRYNKIKQRILDANLTPSPLLEASGTSPQKLALSWIAQQDPAQLAFDHPALLDRYCLAVFYFISQNAADGGWTNSDGWLTGTGICAWYGIECVPREQEATEENEFNPFTSTYDDNDRVIGILLNDNGIESEIPHEWGIGLDRLITLNLDNNELHHTLPSTLGKLENLRSLLLENNRLTGSLTSEIGALSNIHQLNLARNSFEGPIPASWSHLKELRNFAVSNNLLTGKLPDYFAEMTKMIGLFLSDNDLEGDLSFVENMSELMDLRLSKNRFSGDLGYLSSLHKIESIDLDTNQFETTLPDMFDYIYRIREFNVQKNKLYGPIPQSVTHMQSLKTLNLSRNQFNSTIPHGLGLLTDAVSIFISNNELTGPIPTYLGRLEDIVHLDLHSNSLTGEIPSELAHCFRLKELNLSFNKLEDSIPAELGNLRKLETFHLQGNSIVDATMPPQICALREFGLSVLVADCAEEGKVSCECCSECQ